MKTDVVAQLLKGQAHGKVMWISVRGSSMRPLLTGGESLKVVRCSRSALHPGDIAILLRSDGTLIAHLVTSTSPLTTGALRGIPDEPGLEVLARAVSIRRGSIVVPLLAVARPALLALQRGWSWATRARPTRTAYGLAAAVVASERTGWIRSLLGSAEILVLGPDAQNEMAVALSRWIALGGRTLDALLRDGVAVGAFRRGRLVGLAFARPDGVLRYAYLQRRSQGLGVELAMLERATREAVAQGFKLTVAEIVPSQPGFLAAARAFGLQLRPPTPLRP